MTILKKQNAYLPRPKSTKLLLYIATLAQADRAEPTLSAHNNQYFFYTWLGTVVVDGCLASSKSQCSHPIVSMDQTMVLQVLQDTLGVDTILIPYLLQGIAVSCPDVK